MKLVIIIFILFIAGCSIKFCNCMTDEQVVKIVDENSTSVEFDVTPY